MPFRLKARPRIATSLAALRQRTLTGLQQRIRARGGGWSLKGGRSGCGFVLS